MIIKSITVERLGPFYAPIKVDIDPRVTIITGANDVGKSSLLRAIELALTEQSINNDFANHDHVQSSPKAPEKDEALRVSVVIELTESVDLQRGKDLAIIAGDRAEIIRRVGREVVNTATKTFLKNYGEQTQFALKLPAIIRPGAINGAISNNEINLKELNPLEQALLDTGFKAKFELSRFEKMHPVIWGQTVRSAQLEINRLLSKVLPSPGVINFELLADVGGDRSRIGVLIRDRHGAITPFGSRGSGLRRMITFLAELITYHRGAHHKIVLLDEPENSLHADAQHLLREFLYNLTSDGKTQVIYATHSPAMVNPMRGTQLRVLYRTTESGFATSKLLPKPEQSNFLGLRTSLGISAADSLLYAPVTVITEGSTEQACLPDIIEKLESVADFGFSDARKILGLATFLDGNGDSFEYLCRLAKANGAKVVVFLDGDKRARVAQLDMEHAHPDVPVVFLPGQSEFEEIVPTSVYLRALGRLTDSDLGDDAEVRFNAWIACNPRLQRFAFSKRVERWFTDNYDACFPSKNALMQKAIALAQPAQISAGSIQSLLGEIRKFLENTSFE